MNWLDDYFDWLQPFGDPPCCRVFRNGTFCSSTGNVLSLIESIFMTAKKNSFYCKRSIITGISHLIFKLRTLNWFSSREFRKLYPL